MTRTLLVRGLVVGLVAGLVAFVIAYVFGEPSLSAAIAAEEAGHHDPGEVALVNRNVQSTAGLLVGLLAIGAAFGGLFGTAFAVTQGRLGQIGDRTSAGLMALVGFVTIYLVPFIKYPPNPPGVGNPATIGRRTQLFFAMMALSILAAVATLWLARMIYRFAGWDRALIGIGIYLALVTICMAIMPKVDEVGSDFPASTLWEFRTGSLLTQLALWTTLGLLYGALTERSRLTGGEGAVKRTSAQLGSST